MQLFGLDTEDIPSGLVKTSFHDALQAVHIDEIRFMHKLFDIVVFFGFKALEPGGICFGYALELFACKNCDADMGQKKEGNSIMDIHR